MRHCEPNTGTSRVLSVVKGPKRARRGISGVLLVCIAGVGWFMVAGHTVAPHAALVDADRCLAGCVNRCDVHLLVAGRAEVEGLPRLLRGTFRVSQRQHMVQETLGVLGGTYGGQAGPFV